MVSLLLFVSFRDNKQGATKRESRSVCFAAKALVTLLPSSAWVFWPSLVPALRFLYDWVIARIRAEEGFPLFVIYTVLHEDAKFCATYGNEVSYVRIPNDELEGLKPWNFRIVD